MTQTGQKRDGHNRKIPANTEFFHLKCAHIIIKIQKNTNGWLLTCMGSQVRVLYCPPDRKALNPHGFKAFCHIDEGMVAISYIFHRKIGKSQENDSAQKMRRAVCVFFVFCIAFSGLHSRSRTEAPSAVTDAGTRRHSVRRHSPRSAPARLHPSDTVRAPPARRASGRGCGENTHGAGTS